MTELISIVVPIFNEAAGVPSFFENLQNVLKAEDINYEVVFCDDGSTDNTKQVVKELAKQHASVRLVSLSRNFGKEAALAAGISQAQGDAIITIDGDGQHPPELIPKFIDAWRSGKCVVVGVRTNTSGGSLSRRVATAFYYKLLSLVSRQDLAKTTDFCLIDKSVKEELLQLGESNRINRGLIEWLGFSRGYIKFEAKARTIGNATYSSKQLFELARNSIVSTSPLPLYFFGGIGLVITPLSLLAGIVIFIEALLLNDPLGWKITGTAMLGILIIFLIGLVLMAIGMLSAYIWHIHTESKRRPLFIIDREQSVGLTKTR